jgi:large subunit ribosomal protein L24
MLKFKKGDTVKVTTGKDKGREGKIEKIFPQKSLAVVDGVNIYKKHVKGVSGQKGGIYDIPRPLSFSKISIVCPKCKKAARIGFKVIQNEKVRICKKCKKEIDKKS